MKDYEERSCLACSEDNSTVFSFADWTSAVKLKNSVNPLLRVDVGVLRFTTETVNEIKGYQLTVYDIKTQAIIYRFYINYIENNVFSMTTDEAIEFLNRIGFNCEYHEPIVFTDNARQILEACLTMGYTHIRRISKTTEFELLHSEDENITGTTLRDVLAKSNKDINYYDFRFIDSVIPDSIEVLLKN